MSALDELFSVPVEEFIATRDALAKKLKAAGDKDGAAEVKKQHKPTVAAHALNQLARSARAEIEELFEASKALASGKDFDQSLARQRAALEAVKQKAGDPALVAVLQGAAVDPVLAAAVREARFSKLPEAVPVGFFGAAPEGAPPVVLPPKEEPRKWEPPPPLVSAPKKKLELAPPLPAVDAPPPSPSGESPAAQLKTAEKEAEALAAEVEELERELVDAKHRHKEAADRVTRLKARQ